jgi:hypothetical protein
MSTFITPMISKANDIDDKKSVAMEKAVSVLRLVQEAINDGTNMSAPIISSAIAVAADLIDEAKIADEEFLNEQLESGIHICFTQREAKSHASN